MKPINAVRIVALLTTVAGAVIWTFQGGLDPIETHVYHTWADSHPVLAWAMVTYLLGEAFCLAIRALNKSPQQ